MRWQLNVPCSYIDLSTDQLFTKEDHGEHAHQGHHHTKISIPKQHIVARNSRICRAIGAGPKRYLYLLVLHAGTKEKRRLFASTDIRSLRDLLSSKRSLSVVL